MAAIEPQPVGPMTLEDVVDSLLGEAQQTADLFAERARLAQAVVAGARDGALDPDRVLRAAMAFIEKNPGPKSQAGALVDDIFCWALDHGARFDCAVELPDGARTFPMAAVLASRTALPRAEAWLMAKPGVEAAMNADYRGSTLAHALIKSHDLAALERAIAGGLTNRMDSNGAWPWEMWAGEMDEASMQKLADAGFFPRDTHDYLMAAKRLVSRGGKASFEQAARAVKMGAIAKALGPDGGNKEKISAILALLSTPPCVGGYGMTNGDGAWSTLPAGNVQTLLRLHHRELTEAIMVPAGKGEEAWTAAGAVLWAAMVGCCTLVNGGSQRGLQASQGRLADAFPAVVKALEALPPEAPIWDTAIFRRGGQRATLRGLWGLVRTRDGAWQAERISGGRRYGHSTAGAGADFLVQGGPAAARDQAAAIETFLAAGGRFGSRVRVGLGQAVGSALLNGPQAALCDSEKSTIYGGGTAADRAQRMLSLWKACNRTVGASGGADDAFIEAVAAGLPGMGPAAAREFMGLVSHLDSRIAQILLAGNGVAMAKALVTGIRSMAEKRPEVAAAVKAALPAEGAWVLDGLPDWFEQALGATTSMVAKSMVGSVRKPDWTAARIGQSMVARDTASLGVAMLLAGCACALFPKGVMALVGGDIAAPDMPGNADHLRHGLPEVARADANAANWIVAAAAAAALGEGGAMQTSVNGFSEARAVAMLVHLVRRHLRNFEGARLGGEQKPAPALGSRFMGALAVAPGGSLARALPRGTDWFGGHGGSAMLDMLRGGWARRLTNKLDDGHPLALMVEAGLPIPRPLDAGLTLHGMLGGHGLSETVVARMKAAHQAFVIQYGTVAAARPRRRA